LFRFQSRSLAQIPQERFHVHSFSSAGLFNGDDTSHRLAQDGICQRRKTVTQENLQRLRVAFQNSRHLRLGCDVGDFLRNRHAFFSNSASSNDVVPQIVRPKDDTCPLDETSSSHQKPDETGEVQKRLPNDPQDVAQVEQDERCP
jgi:hypothetical protein